MEIALLVKSTFTMAAFAWATVALKGDLCLSFFSAVVLGLLSYFVAAYSDRRLRGKRAEGGP